MADEDRRTGIEGDQIKDHTVRPEELQTVDDVKTPGRWQVLLYDVAQSKMRWFYTFGNRIMK